MSWTFGTFGVLEDDNETIETSPLTEMALEKHTSKIKITGKETPED